MTKGYVDIVIRMFKPECKEEAKKFCVDSLKGQMLKKEITPDQYREIRDYIKAKESRNDNC